MKKRILALILSLVLLLSLLPTAAFADDGKHNLYLGSVQVTDDNRYDILGDGTASYNPTTKTLVLNGYDGDAISAGFDLNIILAADSLSKVTTKTKIGIYAEGNISISGSGSLIVKAEGDFGIYACDGSVMLALGGDLKVYSTKTDRCCAITCDDSITVTGTGSLYVEAQSDEDYSNGLWAQSKIAIGVDAKDTIALTISSITGSKNDYACGMYCGKGDIQIGGCARTTIYAGNTNPAPNDHAFGVYLASKARTLKISSLGTCQRIIGDTAAVYNEEEYNHPVEYADPSRYSFFGSEDGIMLGIVIAFSDVLRDSYYESAVNFAVLNGITTGTSATAFSPNKPCTRAQAVTFLWRACDCPGLETPFLLPFTDVPVDSYYYNAVEWAVSEGITTGTSATTFSPDKACTRAQIVTFLWRAAGEPDAAGSNPFTDVADSAFYYKPVLWAVENGITAGTSATTFSPDKACTRAQIVTFLWRFLGDDSLHISSEPMDQTFTEDGEKLAIHVGVAGGRPPYTYEWHYCLPGRGSDSWFLIDELDSEWASGWDTDTLIDTIWASQDDGTQVYCVITDADGESVTSRTMTITEKA